MGSMSLMRDRANFKQQFWINIYVNSEGIVWHKKVFNRKRLARKAAKCDKPSYRINIKPKKRNTA